MLKSKPVSPKKGGRFEVKVARLFGEWLYGDKKALYKSRGSGAMYTKGGSDIDVGDISPMKPNIYWPLCVECKARELDCSFDVLIRNKEKSQLYKWWVKNEKEAIDNNLFPLLVIKKNHLGEFVIFSDPDQLKSKSNIFYTDVRGFFLLGMSFPKGKVLYTVSLNDFIQYFKRDKFLNYLKSKNYGIKHG